MIARNWKKVYTLYECGHLGAHFPLHVWERQKQYEIIEMKKENRK